MNKLLTSIRAHLHKRREEVATNFTDLVNELVDAELSDVADMIDPDAIAESLHQLGKNAAEVTEAVELVGLHRRYCDLIQQTGGERRVPLPSLESPHDVLVEFVGYFRQQIALLDAVKNCKVVDDEVEQLAAELESERQQFIAAEKRWIEKREQISEPLRQKQAKQSQQRLSIAKADKLCPPKSARQRELESQLQTLQKANVDSLRARGSLGNSGLLQGEQLIRELRGRVGDTGFADHKLKAEVERLTQELSNEIAGLYEAI
ncbi:MAG: hypothetical protein KDA71_13125 [Planctomycetales bacterium]|nr:hypothetical protein [Planctomycetales bacterium]